MELPEIAAFIKENQSDASQADRHGSSGYTVVLDTPPRPASVVYSDTPLRFSGRIPAPAEENVPDLIRKMRTLYEYENGSFQLKCRNFYRQGVLMQDYEDDAPWTGEFVCYFPTYHDLTLRQLRGYFSWRTSVRKGEFRPIPTSAAYIYVYELLNEIGISSPTESLEKLSEFESGYLDSGIGDSRMRKNLHRWMLDFAVVHNLPPETILRKINFDSVEKDMALAALRNPMEYTEEEVFTALNLFSKGKLAKSPVITGYGAEGRTLFSEAWRAGAAGYRFGEKDLFALCFGELSTYRWYPLANAVYYWRKQPEDREYQLNECRRYFCRKGVWTLERYEGFGFDLDRLQTFLRASDRLFRRYLKTGHYLPAKEKEAWAEPFAESVIASDIAAKREAAKPKITIDLTGLDQIREDALITRDSLLTEEERAELEAEEKPASALLPGEMPVPSANREEIPLDDIQIQILFSLLRGTDTEEIIQTNHLMPSLVADKINEALYDIVGDTVVSWEEEKLSLIEDYRDDVKQLLEGSTT